MHERFIDSHGASQSERNFLAEKFLLIYLMTCVLIGALLINPKIFSTLSIYLKNLSHTSLFYLTLINCYQSHHFFRTYPIYVNTLRRIEYQMNSPSSALNTQKKVPNKMGRRRRSLRWHRERRVWDENNNWLGIVR